MVQLVLFDCDGTLLVEADPLAQDAMLEALSRMTGVRVTKRQMDGLDHEARTARWLARELIRRHDLPRIDLDAWSELVQDVYCEELDGDARRRWEAPPGACEALAALVADGFRLALMTGVPERIARTRMDRLGLGEFLADGQGAFGSEADDRHELVELALERAGCEPSDAIAVGDTGRDVRSAHEQGLRVIAVQFDGARPANARDADGFARTMPELVSEVRRVAAAPRGRYARASR